MKFSLETWDNLNKMIIGKWEIIKIKKIQRNNIHGGTRILHGDMTFSKKLPRVSDGFLISMWRAISLAHNLLTVIQEEENFTQH